MRDTSDHSSFFTGWESALLRGIAECAQALPAGRMTVPRIGAFARALAEALDYELEADRDCNCGTLGFQEEHLRLLQEEGEKAAERMAQDALELAGFAGVTLGLALHAPSDLRDRLKQRAQERIGQPSRVAEFGYELRARYIAALRFERRESHPRLKIVS